MPERAQLSRYLPLLSLHSGLATPPKPGDIIQHTNGILPKLDLYLKQKDVPRADTAVLIYFY